MKSVLSNLVISEHRLNDLILEKRRHLGRAAWFYGFLRSRFGRWLYASPFCPARTSPSRLLALALRKDDIYLDVGANKGQMVSLASDAVGDSGFVYAFEPQTALFQYLEQMRTVYRLHNVRLFHALVGDQARECVFYENLVHPSSSSLFPEWSGGERKFYPMTTLDGWALENGVARADLIKIDVEGAEFKVLQGARAWLARTRPLILLEIHSLAMREKLFGYTLGDIWELLETAGYTEFYCLRSRLLAAVRSPTDILQSDDDLLAFADHPMSGRRQVLEQLRRRF